MCYFSYLTDNQYLVSDVFIIFPLAFFIAQTGSYENLTKDVPESSLLSVSILSSIIIHMLLTFIFQFSTRLILKTRNWYVNTCEDDDNTVFACSDNTALFLVGNMQYLISAISFSMDYPYRKPFYTNSALVMYLVIALFLSIYFIVGPAGWVKKLLTLDDFEDPNFKYIILAICIVNFIVDWCVEKFLIRWIEIWESKRKIKNIKKKLGDMYSSSDQNKISEYVAVEMYNRDLNDEERKKERMFF
jgi:cation-transporting ATPase 13A3/4/5